MSTPLVSVILPVYNSEAYIELAIKSILLQTYRNLELIVIDDGSTDSSRYRIQRFKDKRLRLIHLDTNMGLINALNTGFRAASGEYIARMDADDIAMPWRIKKQIIFMRHHPEVDVCGGSMFIFGKTIPAIWRYPLTDALIKARLLFAPAIAHPTAIFRRTSISDEVLYDPKTKSAEDYALWVRMMNKLVFANIQSIVLAYRIHKCQETIVKKSNSSETHTNVQAAILSNFGIKYSNEDLKLHEFTSNVRNYKDKITIDDFLRIKSWLEKLFLEASHSSCPKVSMDHIIGKQLYNAAYAASGNGMKIYHEYIKSVMGDSGLKNRITIFINCYFKIAKVIVHVNKWIRK